VPQGLGVQVPPPAFFPWYLALRTDDAIPPATIQHNSFSRLPPSAGRCFTISRIALVLLLSFPFAGCSRTRATLLDSARAPSLSEAQLCSAEPRSQASLVQFVEQMRQLNASFFAETDASLLREFTSQSRPVLTPDSRGKDLKLSLHLAEGDVFPTVTFPAGSPGQSTLRLDPFLRPMLGKSRIKSISRIAVSPDTLNVAVITKGQSVDDLAILKIHRLRNSFRWIKLPAYDISWTDDSSLLISTLIGATPRQVYLIRDEDEPILLYSAQQPAYEVVLAPHTANTHSFIEARSPTSSSIFSFSSSSPSALHPVLTGDLPGANCTYWQGHYACLSFKRNRFGDVLLTEQRAQQRVLAQGSQLQPITRIHSNQTQLLIFSSTGTASVVQVFSNSSEPPRTIEPLGPVTTISAAPSQPPGSSSLVEAHSFLARARTMTVDELINFHQPGSQAAKNSKSSKFSYSEEALRIPSSDGVAIPVSLVRPLKARGLLLRTYGAYGISSHAEYSLETLALLEQGIAVAVAHVRGGGELGPAWHAAGRGAHKKRSVEDLVAVTKGLQEHLQVSPTSTILYGRSAGGWLVAHTAITHTALCSGIILDAPLLNVAGAVASPHAPLYYRELAEWGNVHAAQKISAINLASTQSLPLHIFLSVPMKDSLISPEETLSWALKTRCRQQDGYAMVLHTMPNTDHDGPTTLQDVRTLESLQRGFTTQVISSHDKPDFTHFSK
jgi:oligopeptidase B